MSSSFLNLYISNIGYYFLVKDLTKHISLAKVKSKLTIKRSMRMGNRYKNIERYLYKIVSTKTNNIIMIAKNSINDIMDLLKIEIKFINNMDTPHAIPDDHLIDGIILDENQVVVSKYLNNNLFNISNNLLLSSDNNKLSENKGRLVLVMNTGLGKTYVAAHKIKKVKLKTLIIVPSKNILEEWMKALSYYTNLRVGCYFSNKKLDGDVVIMTVQSAMSDIFKFSNKSKNSYSSSDKNKYITEDIKYYDYFKLFGFVIYDEIHSYVSGKRETVFWRINTKYCLGLTATPDENSMKLDIIFEKHCGNILYATKINGFNPQSIKWSGFVYPIRYHGLPEHTKKLTNPSTGWTSHGEMVKQFINDENRNTVIVDLVERLHKEGRNIFIFFELREYAFSLSKKINDRLGLHREDSNELSILMGGSTKEDIDKSQSSQIILTTYGWGFQGLSIPKMDTIIFATPRKAKMIQIIGRILRKSGDTSIKRHIYDIIDFNTEIGKNQYNYRKNIFLDKTFYDFEIKEPEIIKIAKTI